MSAFTFSRSLVGDACDFVDNRILGAISGTATVLTSVSSVELFIVWCCIALSNLVSDPHSAAILTIQTLFFFFFLDRSIALLLADRFINDLNRMSACIFRLFGE